ncbi:hypothetical protein EGW08_014192 [Elysia chlorotica]|uniref:TNFR-Cys domain-containing protein n=1 Tax=Elysia chlorotica TaxID=188477 RepID=A0A3S0ZHU9_ELYCH|nr:hypothetical protein EGW08_014192 [Elysia chlorotica]
MSYLLFLLLFPEETMNVPLLYTIYIALAHQFETSSGVPLDTSLVSCGPGQKLVLADGQKPDVCVPCPSRQYQDKQQHRQDECTRTSYRIVACIDGYYLRDGRCHKCTDCASLGKVQGRACKADRDAVCCDVEGMVVKDEKCTFEPVYCGLGEFLVPGSHGKSGSCQTCDLGYFQDKNYHRLNNCNKCSNFDHQNPRLVLEDECTRFHNIRVRCMRDDFYLHDGDCHTCTNCSLQGKIQGRACQVDQDTICCDQEGMVVINGKCVFEPVYCGPGEYLVLGSNGQSGSCEICPSGQYQNKSKHRSIECLPCTEFDTSNARLVHVDECTRFHNTRFGCKEQFYFDGSDCHTCTKCALLGKYTGKACAKKQNTVCCDFEGMIVKSGTCTFAPIYCKAGEYLVPGKSGQKDECRPCEIGSHNPEHQHRMMACYAVDGEGDSTRASTRASRRTVYVLYVLLLVPVAILLQMNFDIL